MRWILIRSEIAWSYTYAHRSQFQLFPYFVVFSNCVKYFLFLSLLQVTFLFLYFLISFYFFLFFFLSSNGMIYKIYLLAALKQNSSHNVYSVAPSLCLACAIQCTMLILLMMMMMRWSQWWCNVTYDIRKIFINYSAPTIMVSHYFLYVLWMNFLRFFLFFSCCWHFILVQTVFLFEMSTSLVTMMKPLKCAFATRTTNTSPNSRRINGVGTQIATIQQFSLPRSSFYSHSFSLCGALVERGKRRMFSVNHFGWVGPILMLLQHMAKWQNIFLWIYFIFAFIYTSSCRIAFDSTIGMKIVKKSNSKGVHFVSIINFFIHFISMIETNA